MLSYPSNNYDIIRIYHAGLKSHKITSFSIPEIYNCYHSDSKELGDRQGGGVCMYMRSTIYIQSTTALAKHVSDTLSLI